jgi:hypothetical protein
MLTKLKLQPGINRDDTNYTNTGGWFDSNFVRFRNGLPEKIGGWTRVYASQTALEGTCRKLYDWSSIIGTQYLACPTNIKFYVDNSSSIIDITPLRRSVTLANNPITTTNGSGEIVVADVNHGSVIGDRVTLSGSSDVNGILAASINKEFISSIPVSLRRRYLLAGVLARGVASWGHMAGARGPKPPLRPTTAASGPWTTTART